MIFFSHISLTCSKNKCICLQNVIAIHWIHRGHYTCIITGNICEPSVKNKKQFTEQWCKHSFYRMGDNAVTWTLCGSLQVSDTGSQGLTHVVYHFSRWVPGETGHEMLSPPWNCPASPAEFTVIVIFLFRMCSAEHNLLVFSLPLKTWAQPDCVKKELPDRGIAGWMYITEQCFKLLPHTRAFTCCLCLYVAFFFHLCDM